MKKLLLTLVIVFLLVSTAFAMDVTLQWDANTEPDLAGYKIYYDTDSGHPYEGTGATEGNSPVTMTLSQDENSDTNLVEFTVHGLPDAGTKYFAVTAYDDQGLESGYSNEVNTGEIPGNPQNLNLAASGVQIVININP